MGRRLGGSIILDNGHGPTLQISLRIPVDLHRRLKHTAVDRGVTIQRLVSQAIDTEISRPQSSRRVRPRVPAS